MFHLCLDPELTNSPDVYDSKRTFLFLHKMLFSGYQNIEFFFFLILAGLGSPHNRELDYIPMF